MQLHQAFDVTQTQESLLGKGVVASFFEVSSAKLNIRCMLLLVEVLANLHDLIQVILLAINLNCFLVLTRLHIKISRLLPVS